MTENAAYSFCPEISECPVAHRGDQQALTVLDAENEMNDDRVSNWGTKVLPCVSLSG
jgi:hypothetical protein